VTRALCELVAATKNIFAERCTGGRSTSAQAAAVDETARKWVIDYYRPLLGPSHATKLDCLALNLLDQFRLRANLFAGNTSFNEKLHKALKAAYKVTTKRREQIVEQLLVNQQVSTCLLEEEELPVTADPDGTLANAGRRSQPLRFPRRLTAAQLARNRKIPGLCTVLEVEGCETLYCCDAGYYGNPPPPQRGRVANTIRAAPSFRGAPLYDWIQDTGPGGTQHYGQAALVVQSKAGRRKRLVVQREEEAPPH